MRILLDECIPARLRIAFPGHEVRSIAQTAWRGSKDASLLAYAQDHFDVFVTVDRRIESEHDLSGFKIGFVIARVPNNRLDGFKPLFDQLKTAAESVRLGQVIHVVSPRS